MSIVNLKAQGALEYLLILAGAVLIAAIILSILSTSTSITEGDVEERVNLTRCAPFSDDICEKIGYTDFDNSGKPYCGWNEDIQKCIPCKSWSGTGNDSCNSTTDTETGNGTGTGTGGGIDYDYSIQSFSIADVTLPTRPTSKFSCICIPLDGLCPTPPSEIEFDIKDIDNEITYNFKCVPDGTTKSEKLNNHAAEGTYNVDAEIVTSCSTNCTALASFNIYSGSG